MAGLTPTTGQPQMPTPGASGGSPPMGSSPATSPVPNHGTEVMLRQGLSLISKLLGELVPKASGNPEAQNFIMDTMKKIQKFSAGAQQNPNAEQSQIRDLAMKQQQMSTLPSQQPAQPSAQPPTPGA